MKKYTEKEVVEMFNEFRIDFTHSNISLPKRVAKFLTEKGLIKDKLEIGKWYKSFIGGSTALVCYQKTKEFKRDVGYGINYAGNWSCDIVMNECIEATKEEVEEALIKEAKKRGFKEGVTITELNLKSHEVINEGGFHFYGSNIMHKGSHSGWCIFKDGKWAEILSSKKKMSVKEIENELGYKVKIVE